MKKNLSIGFTKIILVFQCCVYLSFFGTTIFSSPSQLINPLPVACLITGEQSGEDLAEWFVQKKVLTKTHNVYAIASTELCNKLSLTQLEGFKNLRNVNILSGIGNLCRQLYNEQSSFNALCKKIISLNPSQLIVIDCPWINVRLIRVIKKALPKTPIIYIAPPELWFWGCWWIDTILKKYCDEIIVLYPHEKDWYATKGVTTKWFGYPYEAEFRPFIEKKTQPTACLALLPGSRESTITKSLPFMCETLKQCKHLSKFEIILVKPPSITQAFLKDIIEKHGLQNNITLVDNTEQETISRCFYALTGPGTITLHLALLGVPHAVFFKTSWINKCVLDYVIQPKAFGLPNLLSQESVSDEFIHHNATPEILAGHIDAVFKDFESTNDANAARVERINLFRQAFLDNKDTQN